MVTREVGRQGRRRERKEKEGGERHRKGGVEMGKNEIRREFQGSNIKAWRLEESLCLESLSLIQENDRTFLEQVSATQKAY